MKNWLNFGTFGLVDHEDMKTEKLQHYNSSDSTTTPTVNLKQTSVDDK